MGAMPFLGVLAALGLVLVALGNNAARDSSESLQPLFWCGLALIYAPMSLRLLGSTANRGERIAIALTMGLALFLVKVLHSPTEVTRFDELGWWRATNDILLTGHAFGDNPINVATQGFPGLSTVTAAVAETSGLSVFQSGLIVIGLARLGLVLGLFLVLERVTGSARAAGIGIVVYACNPSFLYFDAQFGYESLALMLAAVMLLASMRWAQLERPVGRSIAPGLAVAIGLLAAGLVVTHHMSSLATLAFLLLWSALTGLARRRRGEPARALAGPFLPAMILAVGASLWFGLVAGSVTVDELGGVFSRSWHSIVDLVAGTSDSKRLFSGASDNEQPWARVLALASIVPLLALIPAGLWELWRDRVRDPLWWTLGAVALLYPATLGLRLTLASSETSQRASEFVFLGLAFLAAVLVIGGPARRRKFRPGPRARVFLAAVATLCFVGGFLIGELKATRQPGPYLVGAEDRSITAQGIAAAEFAAERLPAGTRTFTDRTSSTLLGAYGNLDPIFGRYGEISLPRILFSPRLDRTDRRAVHGQSIALIVVDRRLSSETPLIGYYVESDENRAFSRKRPVSRRALRKFEHVADISRIYANGAIVIYDTSLLLR
jgi:hypothetical protein